MKALMSFYYYRNRVAFYLFFTDLNISIRIHNQKIDCAFKISHCRRNFSDNYYSHYPVLGELKCVRIIELRFTQWQSNWLLYATIVARKASFASWMGKGIMQREKKTKLGQRSLGRQHIDGASDLPEKA